MIVGAFISGVSFEYHVTAPFIIATVSLIFAAVLSLKLRQDKI